MRFMQIESVLQTKNRSEPEKNRFSVALRPGMVAQWEACPLGMQVAPSSIPTSSKFFRGDIVMKKLLQPISTAILPLPLIQEEQLSVTGERMCTKY